MKIVLLNQDPACTQEPTMGSSKRLIRTMQDRTAKYKTVRKRTGFRGMRPLFA
jgi:hypothetical protein